MKTAIYIEDGVVQLVITPESDHEKRCVGLFGDKKVETQIFTGSFYDCRGGWVRQSHYPRNSMAQSYGADNEDRSLILRVATEAA